MNHFDLAAQIMGLKPMEMIFIAIVILFFFGAKRIPEMAKGVADGIKTFKKSMKDDDDDKDKPAKS
jgi:sec-independent protein translocase protein TatA